jgi:hypothetical protein
LKFTSKAKGVKIVTLLMIVVAIFFIIPAILYILEGGPMIALLPLILAAVSMIIAWGLYVIKKFAWIAALIIGLVGTLIFMADWVNVNVESILGSIACIILLVGLVLERKYYLTA